MSRETHEILSDLAPAGSPDPAGLEQARAAFERGRTGAQGAFSFSIDVEKTALVRSRIWEPRQLVALGVVGLLLVGAGVTASFLGTDRSRAEVAAPPAVRIDPLRLPETCGQYTMMPEAVPVPVQQWGELLDHAVTRPDVPITAPPTFEAVPVNCPDGLATAFFVDRQNEQAFAVLRGGPLPSGLDPETSTGPAEASPVELRGTTAQELVSPAGYQFIWWTEGGDRWHAQGNGVTRDELVSALESLELGSGRVSGVPEGYERVKLPKAGPGTTQYQWMLWQGSVQDGRLESGSSYVSAVWPALVPEEYSYLEGGEVVEFDGGLATYTEGTGPNANSFSWREDGVQYSISDSDADLETMKEIARSMEPIDADDPRLRLDEWNYD
ncbi:hypothetical protein [Myceligenerans pegani]|uniref:Uncharacterized protein n=1 Tax=Myceligenerans pegani TaxID=2776917 RepID=A0ABR9MWC2_9MICO|nr:hypothetical protein [Myceligenerans sp. TRM 65318]MBE1875686.1 hypothetical protein [Myceligenerans sp. TRM 65318]MBE3017957.1 hypothetical protein [Myceligenerans sp. TRM 65318]